MPDEVPDFYILFTWFVIALFTVAMIVAFGSLVQRRVKRRKEYAGQPPAAEEIAYLAGGRDRAIRAALAAQDNASSALRRAVAEAHAARLVASQLLNQPVLDAVDGLIRSLRQRNLADEQGRATADGVAAVRDARDEYARLWPGYKPDWSACTSDERAMAVAVFGDAVLQAIDPRLAAAYPQAVKPA